MKFNCKTAVPFVHKAGSLNPLSFPLVPLEIVHPVGGVTDHTCLPFVHEPVGEEGVAVPFTEVLVKVTTVFTQTVSFGAMVKEATGLRETYIGTILTDEVPQGFEATILAENELLKVNVPLELFVPQLLELN